MILNNTKIKTERANNLICWIILGIILLIVICVRSRLLEIPLERDEGEYAYCGQLILQLVPPYTAAYTMKLPGTCFAYALIMLLFGQTIKGIHLGLLFINCLSIILLFLITKKLLNSRAALIAALCYAILSVSPTVLGFAAHATHFIVLAALAGTFLLLLCLENGRLTLYWGSGFLFGLAFLMKQQGIFFIFWGGFLILYRGLSSRPSSIKSIVMRLLIFGAGAILPFMSVVVIALLSGTFDKFWFWTFKYASKYAGSIPISEGVIFFLTNFLKVIKGFELLWIVALIGILSSFLDKRLREVRWPILAFTLFSFLAICPGFYFRNHYFIMLLPALALLVGIFINSLDYYLSSKFSNPFLNFIPLLVISSAIILGINEHKKYFLFEKPVVLSRVIYGANPFIESIKISEFIKSRTNPQEKIAVLGSEPQIYFYSQRHSATGYIYTYGLMEAQEYQLSMQQEMIKEIERASPKYIIFVRILTSWLPKPESEKHIFKWVESYAQRYYEPVGVVDIISPQVTRYIWGEEARTYECVSPFTILIFERRQAPN